MQPRSPPHQIRLLLRRRRMFPEVVKSSMSLPEREWSVVFVSYWCRRWLHIWRRFASDLDCSWSSRSFLNLTYTFSLIYYFFWSFSLVWIVVIPSQFCSLSLPISSWYFCLFLQIIAICFLFCFCFTDYCYFFVLPLLCLLLIVLFTEMLMFLNILH